MQQGELTVTGQDQFTVVLHAVPDKIVVRFTDDDDAPVPCNPHHVDTLEYEVVHGNPPTLVIKWNVSSLRDVKWHAYY